MSAATANTRRLVLGLAALLYIGVFVAFIFVENPGLGIGNFFYIPVCLVALVTDETLGALAGVLATGLYVVAVVLAPAVPSTQALTAATGIRLVTYTIVGALMGFYAKRNGQLVDRLRDLADRDFITGCGNARAFDDELAKRCAAGVPFALVLADADGLNEINQVHGHASGNAALKRIGEVLTRHAERGDVIARIGGDEFALLTRLPADQIAALQARTNRMLSAENLSATFGVTLYPDDGQTTTELFHKADDRLFAAKLVRQNRATVVALRDRTASADRLRPWAEAEMLELALGRRPDQPRHEPVRRLQMRRAPHDRDLVDDVRLRRLADRDHLDLALHRPRVGDVDEAGVSFAQGDLGEHALTSVSLLTTFFNTAAEIPRLVSTVRVYEPTGTEGSPMTSFTPGFVRSSTVWICAGFDFGTTSTSVFVANWIGFSTRPCL